MADQIKAAKITDGLVHSTMSVIYYLSQTPPTISQLMEFLSDGVLAITVGQSATVTAGGTFFNGGTEGGAKRWLQ